MVAIARGKAAAPLTTTTPPRPGPSPAPPSLPPDWEQHETDAGEAYYYNRTANANATQRGVEDPLARPSFGLGRRVGLGLGAKKTHQTLLSTTHSS